MLEEWVRLEVQEDAYTATACCEFVFANEGPATTLLMGFPAKLAENPDRPSHGLEVKDFQATLDGVPLEYAREMGISPPGETRLTPVAEWVTFEVPFAAGEVRTLVHTYRLELPGDSSGENRLGYVLTTGALWAGPIGRARVEFAMGPAKPWHVTRLFPASFVYDEEANAWIWEASDFRPAYDLRITYNLRGWPEDPWGAEVYPEHAEWRERFEAADRHAAETAWLLSRLQQIRAHVGDEQYDEWFPEAVLARYIASKIPEAERPGPAPPEIREVMARKAESEPGGWVFVARALDRDYDLVSLRVEAVRQLGGIRTVVESYEWRADAPEWPHSKAEAGILVPASSLPGLVIEVTATDAAGNVVAGSPVRAGALTGTASPWAIAGAVAAGVLLAAAVVLGLRRARRDLAAHRTR
jgi:hypothetical protein